MITPREGHTATLLPDGQVLVTGGLNRTSGNPNGTILASAELYDPGSGTWTVTGSMSTARENHTATLLPDGKVLVVGGFSGTGGKTIGTTLASAELYDPASGSWSATGSMSTARESHRATLLPDGKVLVVGGFLETSDSPSESAGTPLESAELYDPRSGTWTATGKMVHGGGTATLLPGGKVLVAGGYSTSGSFGGSGFAPPLATAELYDPRSGSWTGASPKRPIDWMPTMGTLLPNGTVLMACGCDHAGRAAELYDPATGSWAATGTMVADHWRDTATWLPDGTVSATLLADGKVLVAGGGSATLPAAELYDPGRGSWTATAKMLAVRVDHTATLLANGTVLVAGGEGDPFHTLASAELYDPGTASPIPSAVQPRTPSWTATGNMGRPRNGHTATLLADGKVLVAGGYDGSTPLASAELYDPASGSWSATGSMLAPRGGQTATLLRDGKVLVAGCSNGNDVPSAELYDPGTGSWTATGSMVTPRCLDFTSTLLLDGRVLVTGGSLGTGNGRILASAELYDPATGSWTATGSMGTPRYDHTATRLPDGKVLVTGGADHGGGWGSYLASAELYDPGNGTWTATGSLGTPHGHHTATLLPNGKVLVTGVPAELYDPAAGSWTATRSSTTTFAVRATLLDGRVLVIGLVPVADAEETDVEVYDPGTGSWTAAGGKGPSGYRNGFTATLLTDGRVLVAGGFSDPQCGGGCTLASAEVYDPGSP